MQKLINLRTQLFSINIYAQIFCTCISFFCQHRGNFRTSTQYFRPNFCTSTHAAAPSVVYLYVAKKLLQWEHKRCIFTEYRPVIYTLINLPILFMVQTDILRNVNNRELSKQVWCLLSTRFENISRSVYFSK